VWLFTQVENLSHHNSHLFDSTKINMHPSTQNDFTHAHFPPRV